jgi:hypothetical protein
MPAFIAEAIFEVIVNILLTFPGAALRWLFLGRKKSFKELLADGYEINAVVAVFFIAAIVAVVAVTKHYIK